MDQLNIRLHLDNSAFEDHNLTYEVARILKGFTTQIKDMPRSDLNRGFALRDINGNTVGHATFDLEDKGATERAAQAAKQQREIGDWIKFLKTEDIVMILDKAFGVEHPPGTSRHILAAGLLSLVENEDDPMQALSELQALYNQGTA